MESARKEPEIRLLLHLCMKKQTRATSERRVGTEEVWWDVALSFCMVDGCFVARHCNNMHEMRKGSIDDSMRILPEQNGKHIVDNGLFF